ncbi:serine carboxypeptidase 24-like protein [Tanacetum coccineum]
MGNSNDHPQPPVSISSVKDFLVLTAIGTDMALIVVISCTANRVNTFSSGPHANNRRIRGNAQGPPLEYTYMGNCDQICRHCGAFFCDELLENWKDSEFSMLPTYKELIVAGYKILVYGGDTVSVVPVTATRFSLSCLNLTVNTEWYPWCSDSDYDSKIERAIAICMDQSHGVDAKSHNPFDFPSDTDLDPSNNATCSVHYVLPNHNMSTPGFLKARPYHMRLLLIEMIAFKFKLHVRKIDFD